MSAEVASALAFAVAAGVVLVLRPHLSRLPALVQSGRSRVVSGPPLAGVAIFLAVVVSALAFLPLEGVYRGILIGLGVIAVVGFLADSRGLSPLAMFAGQLAAAIVPVLYGVSIDRFTFPLVGVVADVPDWLGQPLAVAWILVFVRLVDFVDGVDGLAAAVCALASVVFVRALAAARRPLLGDPLRDHRRRERGLPRAQLLPGAAPAGARGLRSSSATSSAWSRSRGC